MRPATDDTTADELLNYLTSAGTGGEWVPFAALGEWEALYNLRGEARFIGRLARNLADRGLAETRRVASGTQLRVTPAGEDLAGERRRIADVAACELDWYGVAVSPSL